MTSESRRLVRRIVRFLATPLAAQLRKSRRLARRIVRILTTPLAAQLRKSRRLVRRIVRFLAYAHDRSEKLNNPPDKPAGLLELARGVVRNRTIRRASRRDSLAKSQMR